MARAPKVGGYELLEVLGIGGVGVAYLARKGEEQLVVKLLKAGERGGIWNGWARFRHEAMALRRLTHRAIVGLIEAGELPDGQPFLALELARGEPLSKVLERKGSLGVQDALRVVLEVLSALVHAHDKGVVHRDLKPSNIMIEGSGASLQVKVLDFGLAQMVDGPIVTTALTRTDFMVGTPRYMAPEQLAKGTLDCRCDLYALGLVWFEMCEGDTFLGADHPTEMLARRLAEQGPPISSYRLSALPEGLRAVLARSLRAQPEQRYSSALEMMAALQKALEGEVISLASGPTWRERAAGPFAQVLAGLLAAAAVGLVGWWITGGEPTPQNPDAKVWAAPPTLQTLSDGLVLAQQLLGSARLASWEMHRGEDGAWTTWAWFVAARQDGTAGNCVVELRWGPRGWEVAPEVGRCGIKPLGMPRCEPSRALSAASDATDGPVSLRYTLDAHAQPAWVIERAGVQQILADAACAGGEKTNN